MDRYSEHFLDANVIIGSILKWNKPHQDAYSYFKMDYSKNTSRKVYDECRLVFIKNEEWTLRFIKELNDEFKGKSVTNPKRSLHKFRDGYISRICAYDSEKCDNVQRVIFNFVEECEDELLSIMADSFNYNKFKTVIISTFSKALTELDTICYGKVPAVNTYKCPEKIENECPVQFEDLHKVGIHKSDNRILLDSHYFRSFQIRKDIAFITSDRDLIKNKDRIQDILGGMYIFPPII